MARWLQITGGLDEHGTQAGPIERSALSIMNTTTNLWTLPDGCRVPIDEAEGQLLGRLSRMECALGEAVAEVARFYEQTGRPLRARVYVARLTTCRETPEWTAGIQQRLERLLGQASPLGPVGAPGASVAGVEPGWPTRRALAPARIRGGASTASRHARRASRVDRLRRVPAPAAAEPMQKQPPTRAEA